MADRDQPHVKPFVSYGPGFSGDHDTEEKARAVVAQHGAGAVYRLWPVPEYCRHGTRIGTACRICNRESRRARAEAEEQAELEVLCPACQGRGGEEERRRWYDCTKCDGAGYLPTTRGKPVLELMRHQFDVLFREALARTRLNDGR